MEPNKRIKRGWMNLKVSDIKDETHDTKTFYLVDADEGGRCFDYHPGQYLTFRFDNLADKPIGRSYTMSSSPSESDAVAFTVKKVDPGFISQWLYDKLKIGDTLRARGPIGKFCFDHTIHEKHICMVAAGSGVTPFISALREFAPQLTKPKMPHKMTLIVSYRSTKDLICWDLLTDIKKFPGIEIHCTLSREKAEGFYEGRIDDALLEKVLKGKYENTTFFTCGPQEMMDLVEKHVFAHGVAEKNFMIESFAS